MPLLDLMAVLGALAAGLIGAGVIVVLRSRRRAADPRALEAERRAAGARNVEQLQLEQARRCSVCDLVTDPAVDLYIQGSWYHRNCYLSLSAEASKEEHHE